MSREALASILQTLRALDTAFRERIAREVDVVPAVDYDGRTARLLVDRDVARFEFQLPPRTGWLDVSGRALLGMRASGVERALHLLTKHAGNAAARARGDELIAIASGHNWALPAEPPPGIALQNIERAGFALVQFVDKHRGKL